jgi:hypothetical protein
MEIGSKEYQEKCFNIFSNGGTLWLIQRTDTHEFCCLEFMMFNSSKPETYNDRYSWKRDISFFHVFSLTKEDAEFRSKSMYLFEGGCKCCGHGSKTIPLTFVELKFLNNKPV